MRLAGLEAEARMLTHMLTHIAHVLTLGADHYDGDVGTECTQLAVELIELLEAGLVLQTEHQDDSIHPAAELQEEEGEG